MSIAHLFGFVNRNRSAKQAKIAKSLPHAAVRETSFLIIAFVMIALDDGVVLAQHSFISVAYLIGRICLPNDLLTRRTDDEIIVDFVILRHFRNAARFVKRYRAGMYKNVVSHGDIAKRTFQFIY